MLPSGRTKKDNRWRGSGAGTPSAPMWSRGATFQSVRRNAKRRRETTGGTPANRLRESGYLVKTRPGRAQRQEWQIVQSWFNLDDSLP